MTDSDIRARAEAYIDAAVAAMGATPTAAERETAIKKVEAWTRKLEAASRQRGERK